MKRAKNPDTGKYEEKSHVSLERKMCYVCSNVFDTDAVLLDRRLRKSMDKYTVTGYGMCPDCTAKKEDGFIALIGAVPDTGPDFERTGVVVHVRESAYKTLFKDVQVPEMGIVFVDDKVISFLEGVAKDLKDKKQQEEEN